jgi:hypothetical protein
MRKITGLVSVAFGLTLLVIVIGLRVRNGPIPDVPVARSVVLASGGKARMVITVAADASQTGRFAAAELRRYLDTITGAAFSVTSRLGSEARISMTKDTALPVEAYRITIRRKNIVLTGGSGRALLYAAYDLLRRVGCRWPAPAFAFFHGANQYIPRSPSLSFSLSHPVAEEPAFAFRKLDVEEGRSHNLANLKELIDWMGKAGFNTLMVPLDYGGQGRVKWDKWRKELTGALQQRGILIEVGGHGYQNFLNASMEGGTLFKKHPDWFGKDSSCRPSPAEYRVFNTANAAAVAYFTANIVRYLKDRPEIGIFDFWPPDGAHWADCPAMASLGSGQDRQATLATHVDSAIRRLRPDLRLEIIAYARALDPPRRPLPASTLVDFCPIDQSFEKQIYDTSSAANSRYVGALRAWRSRFPGDLCIYTYYRKYAWHSLPNVIAHYMQKDLQWYRQVPVQGICCYSEPGDWGTYGLNYYVLSRLEWNPDVRVDSLVSTFCDVLYGAAAPVAARAYSALENTVRLAGNIPFTSLKPAAEADSMAGMIQQARAAVNQAQGQARGRSRESLQRLELMLGYALRDLQIRGDQAAARPFPVIRSRINDLAAFLEANRDKGVFLVPQGDITARLMRYYHVPL